MSKLKELTWEIHQKAERTEFARKLLAGLTPDEYRRYLYNQYMIYSILEERAEMLVPEIRDIFRTKYIYEDLKEIERNFELKSVNLSPLPVVREYERHVAKLNRDGILAHIYVRHFGDMYGGQMIKKRNPGSGTMYNFENVEELKTRVRAMLNDSMADEASRCFEFAIQLFKEINNE